MLLFLLLISKDTNRETRNFKVFSQLTNPIIKLVKIDFILLFNNHCCLQLFLEIQNLFFYCRIIRKGPLFSDFCVTDEINRDLIYFNFCTCSIYSFVCFGMSCCGLIASDYFVVFLNDIHYFFLPIRKNG